MKDIKVLRKLNSVEFAEMLSAANYDYASEAFVNIDNAWQTYLDSIEAYLNSNEYAEEYLTPDEWIEAEKEQYEDNITNMELL